MGLPKEPRQKMINMMYLVLTAMLALNVSSEILNAFKTVNNSIIKSNAVIDDKNKMIYESLAEKLKDPQTAAKAAIWAPKAEAVKNLAADATSFIEDLKHQLKMGSGLHTNDNGEEEFKEDNLDAAIHLMDEKGEGEKLYNKLKDFKAKALAVLNPDEFKDNPTLQAEVKKAKEDFEKSLPINLQVPVSQSGNTRSGDEIRDWTNNYFHMTPTIASLTILSKFQNDVKNSEAQLVDYCHNQIGKVKLVYDKFQAIAQSSSSYAMPGDAITITAGVGAFSDAAKPKITIGGQAQSLNTDGVAVFKTTASGAGKHVVNVAIEYTKPDGTVAHDTREVEYTVGIPSGASVFLEKMNVLYIGVPNPMTISAGSAGKEKMNVGITNGSIKSAGGDRYIAMPNTQGMAKINVTVNGKTTPFEMRVKRLPDPTPMVGGSKGGGMSSAQFKVQGGLIAKLMDSDFDAPYQVLGYTVGANGGSVSVYREVANEGARWGSAAEALIKQAGPGSSVFFDKIKVKGPDGLVRELPGIFFNLK